jgi:hypothetical protein
MIKISFFIELCHYKDSRFNKLSVSKTNLIIECNMRKINSFYTTTTIIATTGSSGNKATTTPPSFSKKVDFTKAIFNNVLNFSDVKSIDIDLKHAIIDRIEYGNVEFKSDNRETFLTLKNAAL